MAVGDWVVLYMAEFWIRHRIDAAAAHILHQRSFWRSPSQSMNEFVVRIFQTPEPQSYICT